MPDKKFEQMQRSVFPWVRSLEGEGNAGSHEVISLKEVVEDWGVPSYLVEDHIIKEANHYASCKSLPFTILLVVSYAVMAIQHLDAPRVRAVENSISFDIIDNANFAFDIFEYAGQKDHTDVNSLTDFWSFMTVGLVPLLFVQEHTWSEDLYHRNFTVEPGIAPVLELPKDKWGLYINYNRIVGGVRMRQERSESVPCWISETLNKFYGRNCRSDVGEARQYDLDPPVSVARDTEANGEYTEWLWVHWPYDAVADRVVELEANMWLDDMTRKVEVSIPIYNGEYSTHALINVNFYFSRGGHIWKEIVTQFCFAEWFTGWTHYVFDALYVCCILWIFFNEMIDILSVITESGIGGLKSEYLDLWNAVDWISVLTGITLMAFFVEALVKTGRLNEAAVAFGELPQPIPENVTDVAEVREYMDQLESAVTWVTFLQRWLARYPCIVVFRLFKAFHAQPRLALVTLTLSNSAVDLAHFLAVCFCVACGFLTSGVLLFGRDVVELSTMERGIIYLFRTLLGDFDYDELRLAGRIFPASLWFAFFCIVVSLLLMNMLLAIVMDAYSVVKSNTVSSMTLVQQIEMIVNAARAHHVPHSVIIRALHEHEKYRRSGSKAGQAYDEITRNERMRLPLFVKDLMGMLIHHVVPMGKRQGGILSLGKGVQKEYRMSEQQAYSILGETVKEYYVTNLQQADTFEYMRLATLVEQRIASINKTNRKIGGIQRVQRAQRQNSRRGITSSTMSNGVNVMDVGDRLQHELLHFLKDVDRDRMRATAEVKRLRDECGALERELTIRSKDPTEIAGVKALATDLLQSRMAQNQAAAAAGLAVPSLTDWAVADVGPQFLRSGSRLARLEEEDGSVEDAIHRHVSTIESVDDPPSTPVHLLSSGSVSTPLPPTTYPTGMPPVPPDGEASPRGMSNAQAPGLASPVYVALLQRAGLLAPDYMPSEGQPVSELSDLASSTSHGPTKSRKSWHGSEGSSSEVRPPSRPGAGYANGHANGHANGSGHGPASGAASGSASSGEDWRDDDFDGADYGLPHDLMDGGNGSSSPTSYARGPVEFSNFRDAQSQLRGMLRGLQAPGGPRPPPRENSACIESV